MFCDEAIFDQIPVKKEVKATISGNYITAVKGVHGTKLEEKQQTVVDNAVLHAKSESDKMIAELKSKIREMEAKHKADLAEKNNEINNLEKDKARAVSDAVRVEQDKFRNLEAEHKLVVSQKESEITNLKNDKKRAVEDAVRAEKDKVKDLESEIEKKELAFNLELTQKEELHKEILKQKEEEIERIKDFKQRQSTKMVGESLEHFCENEFNKLRATGFQTAYFEKDNDSRSGTKGDFIFRDTVDGVEYISIMFEMKNESDETKTKHRNEDFLEKLDKDRNEKGCEYAVLVSMLESDNDYYNTGIVDVSHKYPKMYVIRPQFFIPVITFLRNAAINSLSVRKELAEVKNRNIDVSTFEASLLDFKDKFGRNYELANKRFNTAIEEIDKTIQHLQKVKDELLASDNQLRLANNKLDDLSIKKLTKNNPTMQQMFEEAGVTVKPKSTRKQKKSEEDG